MTIGGVPVSQLSFGQWWMFGSAVLVLIGFVGWRLACMRVGTKSRINGQDAVDEISVIDEASQSDRNIESIASKEVAASKLSAFFLHLLLGSLAAHTAFWIYAGIWLRG